MKPCHCGNTGYSRSLCRYHYALSHPLKRSPLKKSAVRIKPVSAKLKKMKTVYGHIRKDFLDEHEICQAKIPGCSGLSTEIHHRAGREGDRLNDVKLFLAVCRSCHDFIERNPAWAKSQGLSVSRLDKAS